MSVWLFCNVFFYHTDDLKYWLLKKPCLLSAVNCVSVSLGSEEYCKPNHSNGFTLKPLLSAQWHCGFFWDRLEKKARLALIVYAHINKQIYYDLSFICSNCLIPSVNSSDWTHLRVCVLSSCVRVCVLVLFMGRRRRRQTLLPSRTSRKKQTRWSQFDLSWITGHYLNMTRERHPGCDQTACRAVSRCMLAMFNAFQVLLLFWFDLLVPTCHIILIHLNQQHTYRTYCLYGIMHRECAFHRWIGETDQLADL